MNSRGLQSATVAVERDDEHVVGARLAQQVAPGGERAQHRRRVLGAEHGHRMGVEGDRDQGEAALVGGLPGAVDDRAMTAVDAVEVADGDDGGAEVARHVVGRGPDVHGLDLSGRTGQTKTATARACPSRGS